MYRKFVSAMEFANKRIFKIEHFDRKEIRSTKYKFPIDFVFDFIGFYFVYVNLCEFRYI